MEYQTGSYLIKGRKPWRCRSCGRVIITDQKHFARVLRDDNVSYGKKLGTPYHKVEFTRYHVECALKLENLSDYEKELLSVYFIAPHLYRIAPRRHELTKNDK